MTVIENEGRFFGNHQDMKSDICNFNKDGGVWKDKELSWTSSCGTRRVRWFYCEEYNTYCNVAGMRFDKLMLDISIPDKESIMFLLSRLRGGRIYHNRGFLE